MPTQKLSIYDFQVNVSIRGAELHVLKGEGHFFVVTRAAQTADAIREFLQQSHGEEKPAIGTPPLRAST